MEAEKMKRTEHKRMSGEEILHTLEEILFRFPSEITEIEFEGIHSMLYELDYFMQTEFDYTPASYKIGATTRGPDEPFVF